MAMRKRWLLYIDECQARGTPLPALVPEEGVSSRRHPPPMTELRRHTEEKAQARWRKRPESAARPCRWVPQDSLCTATIAETISGGEAGALMHGPTFMANALACAVAVASVELLLSQDRKSRVVEIGAGLTAGLEPARALPGVADVRVCGAIGVIEMHRPVDMRVATAIALDHGVWLRPFRTLIYAMPPFICPPEEIDQITSAMVAVARALG